MTEEVKKPWWLIPIKLPTSLLVTIGPFVLGNTDALDEGQILAHEKTHTEQQVKYGFILWFLRYGVDLKFRKDQELEAYREEIKWLKRNGKSIDRNRYLDALWRESKRIYKTQIFNSAAEVDDFIRKCIEN